MTERDVIFLVLFFAAIGVITVAVMVVSIAAIAGRVLMRAATYFPGGSRDR